MQNSDPIHSGTSPYQHELLILLEAIKVASAKCEEIRIHGRQQTTIKADGSPVTQADLAAQLIIQKAIMTHFPNDVIIAEEDLSQFRDQLPSPSTNQNNSTKRWWVIDPIDGTKGYIANRQYACCVALIEKGQVKVGILGCPRLDDIGALFWATEGVGAFTSSFSAVDQFHRLGGAVRPNDSPHLTIIQSVDPGHTDLTLAQQVAARLGITAVIQMDSQCKYAMVARGSAHIYIRRATRRGYREKIWDHAPGMLLVQEVGGTITDFEGNKLELRPQDHIEVVGGLVVTNLPGQFGVNHQMILQVIQECLDPEQ